MDFPQAKEERVSYVYDPKNPVPTRGGGPLLSHVIVGWGGPEPSNRDQSGLCKRKDVLSFVSPPLKESLHVAGSVEIAMAVSTDVEDTAFTAKLIEVGPDGKALNIQDGITSLACARTKQGLGAYKPEDKTELTIRFWPIDWLIPKGAKLRLDISSSNFPAYHAHANRKGPWAQQSKPIPAKQTLFVGGGNQGYIDLPIVDQSLPPRPPTPDGGKDVYLDAAN